MKVRPTWTVNLCVLHSLFVCHIAHSYPTGKYNSKCFLHEYTLAYGIAVFSLEGKGHLDLITFFNLCMPKIKFLFKTLKLFKIQTAFMNF